MKISFECDCILLQNSLKLFLKDYAAHKKDCDFIISDKRLQAKKPVFVIAKDSAHLQIPFSKDALLTALEEFYSAIQISNLTPSKTRSEHLSLEREVGELVDKFKQELIALIRLYR